MAYTPDQIAAAIIAEGQTARTEGTPETLHGVIAPRGIKIALTTAIVESNERDLANPNVPESEALPNDGDGYDHDSVGDLQQQFEWWGTVAEEMDPRLSAAMFFHALEGQDYTNTNNSPGSYAQAVQQSAYPTRYDAAWPQADAQYNQLTAPAPAPAPVEAPVTDAPPVEIDLSDNNSNCESREGVAPRLFIFHTEEGGMQGPDFEEWMAANEVSYNFIASPDGSIIDMETDDVASWSVLDPANEFSINLCFATSTVNWSRQQWLDNMSAGIKSAAYIAVRECNKYGIPLQILVGPNYPRVRTENGITDHYAITVNQLAPGSTHVDVGPNFPWDVLNSYLQRYAAHPDAPQPQPVAAAPVTYTVQDGDSVSGIAAQFNVTEDALLAANPSITDPDFIEAGQLLTIPSS